MTGVQTVCSSDLRKRLTRDRKEAVKGDETENFRLIIYKTAYLLMTEKKISLKLF